MRWFNYHDFKNLERTPNSPNYLQNKISDLIYCSTNTKARVESVNPETREYRIVIQGTLDWDNPDWGWTNKY